MEVTGRITSFRKDLTTGKAIITLLLNIRELEDIERLSKIKLLNITMKRLFQKRSLDANRYFWKLLSEYSEEKQVDTIEEYKERVKRLGIFRQFRIEADNVNTFKKTWESQGIAWFCEINDTEFFNRIEFKVINAYYGSSSFNARQMSRLINDLVEDCKEAEIGTKPKNEIESMLKEWENEQKK